MCAHPSRRIMHAFARQCTSATWLLPQVVAGQVAAPVEAAESTAAGCAAALAFAKPEDRIVVFGSFHTVGPALDWLEAQGLLPPAALPEYTVAPRTA